MKITATFESFEEFINFANGSGEKAIIEVLTGGAQAPQEAPKKTEAKKSTPKKEEAKEEAIREPEAVPQTGVTEEEAPKQEAEAEAPAQEPKVDESFRVKVRKTLASLNKKTGKNSASELIHDFGAEKLTDVALEDLPALMQKAEEALNA